MRISSLCYQGFGGVSFATPEQKQEILNNLDPAQKSYLMDIQNTPDQQMTITEDGDVYIDDVFFTHPKRINDDTEGLVSKVVRGLRILRCHKIVPDYNYSKKLCGVGSSCA